MDKPCHSHSLREVISLEDPSPHLLQTGDTFAVFAVVDNYLFFNSYSSEQFGKVGRKSEDGRMSEQGRLQK